MRRTCYTLTLLSACLFQAPYAKAQRIVPAGTGVPTTGGSLGIFSVAEENGLLYIGGRFASLNGNVGFNVQSWDGENAVHLAGAFGSLPQLVRALAVHEGDLIAGGSESTFNHVARWDGIAWNAMGDGLPGQVYALQVFDGELYAAGAFNGVARWTGNTWAEVGTPFNGIVQRLVEHQGDLYAAGSFTMDADGTADRKGLVRWNGTVWEQVLSGFNGAVAGVLLSRQQRSDRSARSVDRLDHEETRFTKSL